MAAQSSEKRQEVRDPHEDILTTVPSGVDGVGLGGGPLDVSWLPKVLSDDP